MIRRLNNDERGVTAVVGVICLLVIFSAATLSVDAGNAWQTRRNMITATDASALAEARDLALASLAGVNTFGCTGLYNTILDRNAGTDVFDRNCQTVPLGGGNGYVFVEGRKPVDVRFGVVLGLDDTAAYSMSAAEWGYPSAAQGLLPISFCSSNHHVQEWINYKDGVAQLPSPGSVEHPVIGPDRPYIGLDDNGQPFGLVHRMFFNKSGSDACGTFPGQWGWLDFTGGDQGFSTDELRDWVRTGYNGTVRVRIDEDDPATPENEADLPCEGIPGGGDSSTSAEGCVPGKPGSAGGSPDRALDDIRDEPRYIMIFDAGQCGNIDNGGGATCTLEAWAFLGVKLRGWKITGPEKGRFFDFSFTEIILSGPCCSSEPPNGVDTGVRGVGLCAVDHDPTPIDAATRCGPSS